MFVSASEEHWKVLFRNKYRFRVPVAGSWVQGDPSLRHLCWDRKQEGFPDLVPRADGVRTGSLEDGRWRSRQSQTSESRQLL